MNPKKVYNLIFAASSFPPSLLHSSPSPHTSHTHYSFSANATSPCHAPPHHTTHLSASAWKCGVRGVQCVMFPSTHVLLYNTKGMTCGYDASTHTKQATTSLITPSLYIWFRYQVMQMLKKQSGINYIFQFTKVYIIISILL